MFADMTYAGDHAFREKAWVVVVVPPEVWDRAQNALVAVATGFPFGGRTAVFPGGGRLSLSKAADPMFLDPPFDVMFLGWGGGRQGATTIQEMVRWREKARAVVSRA